MAPSDQHLGGGLKARIEPWNRTTRIALSGNLNEATNLTPLVELPGPLEIDLSDLRRINSLGVRTWMNFVHTCEHAGIGLTFERCSPVIVNQMSMITRFMGTRSRVSSVLVPYLCTSCQAEHLQLLELSMAARVVPSLRCPKCQGVMELDEVIETYSGLASPA